MHYVYLIRCKDGSLYCGSTKDVKKRLAMHNSGKGSRYVRSRGGGVMVFQQKFKTIGNALRREIAIKKWPKSKKENLIKNNIIKASPAR